jgi:oligopeptide transport system permease protein
VHAPLASLGSLVAEGVNNLQSHPYMLMAPAALLALIIYCFNHLGDGLRDALDTRERQT